MTIIEIIAQRLGLDAKRVENVVTMLDDGSTVPFISRYRKEMTGGMNEVEIQDIKLAYEQLEELEHRKVTVLRAIKEQEKLTPELLERIEESWDPTTLEDIYLPFKPKRRTRAEVARQRGLEPLAKIIMSQHDGDIAHRAASFINDDVPDAEAAIAGASDIIAEWISENERVRNTLRNLYRRRAIITAAVIKGKEEEGDKYANYFRFSQPARRVSSHQYLAIRRGEAEGVLKVAIGVDSNEAIAGIERIVIKRGRNEAIKLVTAAVTDSYKRLLAPSIENEIAAELKEKADTAAIATFADNLRQLLFAPPLGHKRVMGIDPGYRTGCKVVCLDQNGKLLHHDAIFPTPPRNDIALARHKVQSMVDTYAIDAIAIGNGTASRETERFVKATPFERKVGIFVVSEDGASVYSASAIAREEFPDKDVTVRGAVSIGRRLIDPLAELVKIDPKSIGVGQYQHDVDQRRLQETLDFTVESCVNTVGVNVNTASAQLLTYVSGLGPQLAKNIVEYRSANGSFANRQALLEVPRLGAKSFEQAAGFLRIPDGDNPLDNTAVHPEAYSIVKQMATDSGVEVEQFIADKQLRQSIALERYVTDTVGLPTLTDIMEELDKPGRDPRDVITEVRFDDSITTIDDLREGMILNGIVTNITQFGTFVDIGIHENGLIHISEIADHRVASASDVLKLHQQVRVRVIDIDLQRRRIALSLRGL